MRCKLPGQSLAFKLPTACIDVAPEALPERNGDAQALELILESHNDVWFGRLPVAAACLVGGDEVDMAIKPA